MVHADSVIVCGLEAIAVQEKRFPCWRVLSNMVIIQYRSTSGTKAKLPWMANATLFYMLLCVECIGATFVLMRVNSQKTSVSLLQVYYCSNSVIVVLITIIHVAYV